MMTSSNRIPPSLVALLLAATVGLQACGNEQTGQTDRASSCTEGRSVSCTCADGRTGAQVCQPDGTFGECRCGVPTDTTAGNDTATAPDTGTDDAKSADATTDTTDHDTTADTSPDAGPNPDRCCAFDDLDTADSVSCNGMQFDRILHVVDDLGADPTGEEPIDPILEDDLTDNTLLVFPDGDFTSGSVTLEGADIGLVAEPGADPAIVPGAPKSEMGETMWHYDGDGGFLLQGLRYDYTQEGYGNRINVVPSGDFTICDVRFDGKWPDDTKGFRLDVRDASAEGHIERAVMTGGPEETTYDWNGIYVGPEHAGELTIRDCNIENASNNGVYASSPGEDDGANGPVRVIGGLYKNNNIAGVRIGSSGSVVRGVTVVVDSQVPKYNGRNARGIRVRDRRGQVIEDNDLYYADDATGGSGAVSIHKETGAATIRNTRIRMDHDDMPAIRGKTPNVGGEVGLTIENVSITGDAADGEALDIADRPETAISDSCIEQTGSDRDGMDLSRSDDSQVTDTAIEVTGTPIAGDSEVSTSNVSETADCTAPDY
jgi:hypothetical protein